MKYEEIYVELQKQFAQGKWKPGQRLPTERELSQHYGVSRPTISRVLSRLRDAGQIRRVAGAGTFVTDAGEDDGLKHQTFALLVPGLGRAELFEPICARIAERSYQFDFTLTWGSVPADDALDHESHLLATAQRFIDHRVDGIFFQPLEREAEAPQKNLRIVSMFERARIPLVLLDSDYLSYPQRSDHDLVGIDNVQASFVLTNHFLEHGCRRVDFVWQPNAAGTCPLRLIGYREALHRAGIPATPEFEHEGDPRSISFARELFDGGARDIICLNDETAALLMRSFESLNITVPHDVRIAGFDDVKYARLARVPLTTMRQPCQALGDLAVRTMLERIAHPWLPARTVATSATLCARESSRVQERDG